MNNTIPDKWQGLEDVMPILGEIVDWLPLRQWSLSNVYRITGQTMICKWSDNSLINESDFYKDVLSPLDIARPEIYASHQNKEGSFFIIEDFGCKTLESNPSPGSFINAVHELAYIHKVSIIGIKNGALSTGVYQQYYQDKHTFTDDLSLLQQHSTLQDKDTLKVLIEIGGICWLIHTIGWILDHGRYVIPGSENWVGGLMKDLELLHQN